MTLSVSGRHDHRLPHAQDASRRASREVRWAMVAIFVITGGAWGFCAMSGAYPDEPIGFAAFVLGGFAPSLVAAWFGLRAMARRRKGAVRELVVGPAVGPGSKVRWLGLGAAAGVLGFALPAIAALVEDALLGEVWDPADASRTVEELGGLLLFSLAILVAGPISEEFGWRGVIFPRMMRKWGRFEVCVVLGTVWAVWHLPLFVIPGTYQAESGAVGLLFAILSCYPLTMLLGAVYEDMRAGVLGAILLHFGHNVAGNLIPSSSWVGQVIVLVLHTAAALILIRVAVRCGREPRVS